jgi:8-oxo-dGTP diphosphatase
VPYTYDYPRPALTVDVAVFTIRNAELCLLLIRRAKAPFKGTWALPGGFVDLNEPLEKAAIRELGEETGLPPMPTEQLGAFGDPGRDPRGHTVSVAYLAFLAAARPVAAGDDAAATQWHTVRSLPKLAFDHALVIEVALERLRYRLGDPGRSPIELVPQHFTLSELQHVHEAVLGHEIDKRNFRARLLAKSIVEPVGAARKLGRHRPAQLYRLTNVPERPVRDEETVRIRTTPKSVRARSKRVR